MKNHLVGIVILTFVLSLHSFATDTHHAFKASPPEQYIVKKDDTLWDISNEFLLKPWFWPEIWHINPQIENPHLIFPGDVIRIVTIDGQPRLTVERTYKASPGGFSGALNTEKLQPKFRTAPITDAIPAIPLEQINSWLLRNRVVAEGELEAAPYVVAGQEKRLILGTGDQLFGRGEFANNIPTYGIYRKGENYVDPDTGELLGVQAIDMGSVSMRALDQDIATLSVTRTTGDIRIGDRILPTPERTIETSFFPSEPDEDIDAKIISVERGVSQVGMLDVVAINTGEREGVYPGNILAIYRQGEVVTDRLAPQKQDQRITLPDQRAGMLMIFQTFEKMSLALVLKADRGIRVGDFIRNP